MHFSRLPGVIVSAFQSSLPQTGGKIHQATLATIKFISIPTCGWQPVIEASCPTAPLRYMCQTSGRAVGAVKPNSHISTGLFSRDAAPFFHLI